jgi:DNA modification methylase
MPSEGLEVERWPVGQLLPYAANARTHSDEQIAQIAGSIAAFGFNVPCLVDERGVLIAGHGRLLAARRLGLTDVPIIRLGHLTESQARAYRLADNRIALNAGWDDTMLAAELERLRTDGADLGLLGFDDAELDRLINGLGNDSGADEDAVPEAPGEAVTKPGDLWLLSSAKGGRHRLLCGDATVATDVERLLGDLRPNLMVTDPPYGVDYDPSWRRRAGVNLSDRMGTVRNDDRADWREAWALFPGDAVYIWHAGVHARTVAESLEVCGFQVRAQIVWTKPRFVLGRGDYHWGHEPCWYGVRKGGRSGWQGARDQSTVWAIGNAETEDDATVHGTQKPVECMRRPLLNNSAAGDVVYEPFAGSGTSFIAAETSGRVCVGLEIEPGYCDIIVSRWQRFTGQLASLDGDGRGFDDIAADPSRAETRAEAQ